MAKRWYVVHAYSGFEKNVARALKERIGLSKLEEYFGQVLVPTEEVVEMRAGQKRRSERKFFPGYVLVEMELNDETWHLVKETPRVMGFIGGKADRPAPLTENEAKAARVPVTGSKAGKKTSLKIRAAAVPKMKKSYHSIVVPMRLAKATLRDEWRDGTPLDRCDVSR